MISPDVVLTDTRTLIGIDSQNPGPLEGKCAEWVGNRLTDAGVATERMPVAEGRDNVVARVPGEGSAPGSYCSATWTPCPWARAGPSRRSAEPWPTAACTGAAPAT